MGAENGSCEAGRHAGFEKIYAAVDVLHEPNAGLMRKVNALLFLGTHLSLTAGALMELQRQLAEAQRQAMTDPLTGLHNRRFMEETLVYEVGRAQRGHPLTMVIIDVDHFKDVNDTYGHLFGDKVLREVGKRCISCVRGGDVVCRFGGEEFTIILPDAESKHAADFAERLRKCVGHENFCFGDERKATITISIGVVQWRQGETMYDLINHADRALYEAKGGKDDGGRDRTAVYGEDGQIRIHQPGGLSTPGVE